MGNFFKDLKKRNVFIIILLLLVSLISLFIWKSSYKTITVTFIDSITEKELTKFEINKGDSVIPPKPLIHEDYLFIGWFLKNNKKVENFNNILKNETFIAIYGHDKNNNGILDSEDDYFNVVFYDPIAKKNISSQKILIGMDAIEPKIPSHKGYEFHKFSHNFENITSDLKIDLLYKKTDKNHYYFKTVNFGKLNLQKEVKVYNNELIVFVKNLRNKNGDIIANYNKAYQKLLIPIIEIENIAKAELSNGKIINIKG